LENELVSALELEWEAAKVSELVSSMAKGLEQMSAVEWHQTLKLL
jgi:hypothetical protein